jgi:hypothetical protein
MTSEKSEDLKSRGYVYINMQFDGLILIDQIHTWDHKNEAESQSEHN